MQTSRLWSADAQAVLTGHFCFRFTTGLTYRWRSYYDLLPVLVRLLSLQALCWPATYLPLWYLGPSQPLFAWAVIGVSTGFTYAVIMWLASNVVPDPGAGESGDNHDHDHDHDHHGDGNEDTNTARRGSGNESNGDGNSEASSRQVQKGERHRQRKRRRRAFPNWGDTPLQSPPEPPAFLSRWEKLNYRRRWDWDLVASEVGWKVGGLVLFSAAWVFWQVHIGWLVRPEGWDEGRGGSLEV